MTRRFFSWKQWGYGLANNSLQAGATAVVTLLTTNGLDQLGLHGVAMNWKQFLTQIAVHVIIGAAKYIQQNRLGEVTEEIETQITEKQ